MFRARAAQAMGVWGALIMVLAGFAVHARHPIADGGTGDASHGPWRWGTTRTEDTRQYKWYPCLPHPPSFSNGVGRSGRESKMPGTGEGFSNPPPPRGVRLSHVPRPSILPTLNRRIAVPPLGKALRPEPRSDSRHRSGVVPVPSRPPRVRLILIPIPPHPQPRPHPHPSPCGHRTAVCLKTDCRWG